MAPQRDILISELMTSDVISILPNVDVADAYDLMLRNDIRRLPVVDRDGELIGIITRSDIQQRIPVFEYDTDRYEAELALIGTPVGEVMSWDPVTIAPDETIQDAAERMIEFQVSGLPVVDGNALVGIVTESDIFRFIVESWSRYDEDN